MKSGGVNGSRWGLKGSEDLGGGLKANFDFQAGFNLDDGAGTSTSATAFSRQSWVGLSGGFGATRIGRTTTPYDDVNGSSNAMFDSYLAPFNRIATSTTYAARPNNTLYYQAPVMGGFSGALSYSLAESDTTDDSYSANLTYGAGPFKAQFGYQFEGETPTLKEKQFTRLGGSWEMGAFTFKGTWGQVENAQGIDGRDADEWQLGLDFKTGPWVFTGSYAQSEIDSYYVGTNYVNEESRMGFGLAAAYALSKRTFVYGGYEQDTKEISGSSNYPDLDHSVFAIGMQHKF
jgi:predicted porin